MPSTAKPGALKVGEDLALTPGRVDRPRRRRRAASVLPVHRAGPTSVPILVVPPPIGRYYFLDLRPGRSFVEYSVSSRTADLPGQLAQPGAGPVRLGHRHVRRTHPLGGRRGPRGDREPRTSTSSASAPAASSTPRCSTTSRAAGDERIHSRVVRRHAARLRPVRAHRCLLLGAAAVPGAVELRARPASSAPGDGQRRSPGCAPTTWSGTTGSTTT